MASIGEAVRLEDAGAEADGEPTPAEKSVRNARS
jgi:hypothetical protein